MSDQQKIWFIYITDHHEGPFSVGEIAQKVKDGQVAGQSLAWKDGMPEWVALETIPELAPALAGGGEAAAPSEPAAPEAEHAPAEVEGSVSLAQLLASQQTSESPPAEDPASAPAAMQEGPAVPQGEPSSGEPESVLASIVANAGTSVPEPGLNDEVWTLKIGSQVSGLHSLAKLKDYAGAGEIPADAMLWHPGWSDFQTVASVPQVANARRQGASNMNARSGITRPGIAISASRGFDDESTDPHIEAPPKKGWEAIVAKVLELVQKASQKAAAAKAAPAARQAPGAGTRKIGTGVVIGGRPKASYLVKRGAILGGIAIVLVAVGGGVFYLYFSSPFPSDLDVVPDDREAMTEVVRQKGAHKLHLAIAHGTEDNPIDPSAPKYYVATNLPEGTAISMALTGAPGTLVNRVSFEKTLTANVDKTHLAVFDQVKDENGKPLWGEFSVKVSAEGAEDLQQKLFIGRAGGSYRTRLKAYKETLQGEYDKEAEELREYVTTIKNAQVDASRHIADYKAGWQLPTSRKKITDDWAVYKNSAQPFLQTLDTKIKDRVGGANPPKYNLRPFQEVLQVLGQLQQLVKDHSDRLSGQAPLPGAPPPANVDDLDGLVQAGVSALEQALAQTVSRGPFDSGKDTAKPVAAPKAAPPKAPAPVPVAPAAAAPAAAAPVSVAPAAAPAAAN